MRDLLIHYTADEYERRSPGCVRLIPNHLERAQATSHESHLVDDYAGRWPAYFRRDAGTPSVVRVHLLSDESAL